jgi:hypothetical protein
MAPHGHEGACSVEAREDGRRDAGRVQRVEPFPEAVEIEALSLREEVRALGEAGKRLVSRCHHRVRVKGERVRGRVPMKAEMGAPGLVDDDGHPCVVSKRGEGGDVAHHTDEVRLDEKDGAGIGGFGPTIGGTSPCIGTPIVPVSIFGEFGMFGPADIFGPLGLFGYNGLFGPRAITFPNVFIAGWWNGYC